MFLTQGSTGPEVTAWQNFLLKQGISLGPLGADGDFGSITRAATGLYQTRKGLVANGIVDTMTITAAKADGFPSPSISPNLGGPLAAKLATVAIGQEAQFGGLHETSAKLSKQIGRYWKEALNMTGMSVTATPWSAAFVSWCVKQAGYTQSDFTFAAAHSVFVHAALNGMSSGFAGREINKYAPKIGDIVQNNRKTPFQTFQSASQKKNYESHSAIVVSVTPSEVITIGGNEKDSVRQHRIPVNSQGKIVQPAPNHYICVLENLK